MDKETCWDRTVAARLALHQVLRTLTPEQWEHPSLCEGWRVRDVAAHVISAPQLTWGETLKLLPNLWHGYNGMIKRDGQRRGSAPIPVILHQFDEWAQVRRGPATVGHLEPMLDVLVHSQDIVRPLGIELAMPVDAAAVAADRCRQLALLLHSRSKIRGVTMVAEDTDWIRGTGPEVRGPMAELLMLCAGRQARESLLRGAVVR